jgi:hypothetical protein
MILPSIKLFRIQNVTEFHADMNRNIVQSGNKGILMKFPGVKLTKELECYTKQGTQRLVFQDVLAAF